MTDRYRAKPATYYVTVRRGDGAGNGDDAVVAFASDAAGAVDAWDANDRLGLRPTIWGTDGITAWKVAHQPKAATPAETSDDEAAATLQTVLGAGWLVKPIRGRS